MQDLVSAVWSSSWADVASDHLWSGHHPCGSGGAEDQWHVQEVVWGSLKSNISSVPSWPLHQARVTHDITHRGVQGHQGQATPNVTWLNRPHDQQCLPRSRGRQGLGSQERVWRLRAQGKNRRELFAGELRSFEKHKRRPNLVGHWANKARSVYRMERSGTKVSDMERPVINGAVGKFLPPTLGIWLAPEPCESGSCPSSASVTCARDVVHSSTSSVTVPEH